MCSFKNTPFADRYEESRKYLNREEGKVPIIFYTNVEKYEKYLFFE
jgi:hypothetical protein